MLSNCLNKKSPTGSNYGYNINSVNIITGSIDKIVKYTKAVYVCYK